MVPACDKLLKTHLAECSAKIKHLVGLTGPSEAPARPSRSSLPPGDKRFPHKACHPSLSFGMTQQGTGNKKV
jgi:hypothetical protein